MMYCAPEARTLGHSLTDDDLEGFGWYILTERIGGVLFRFVQSERPT